MKIKTQENNILEKILKSLRDLINVNEKHKKISEKTLKNSMSKKEQRYWNIATIAIMILLGTGIILAVLNVFNNEDFNPITSEIINPEKIILNEPDDIDFEINFTNNGDFGIMDFNILKMDLYRMEDGKPIFKRQLITSFDPDYSITCKWKPSNEEFVLDIGESCIIKTDMYRCPECFDDKEKEVYLMAYIESVPPVPNQKIILEIY